MLLAKIVMFKVYCKFKVFEKREGKIKIKDQTCSPSSSSVDIISLVVIFLVISRAYLENETSGGPLVEDWILL